MKATRIRISGLNNPIGIDVKEPLFTWNCEGGEEQSAYRVLVRDENSKTLYDTGKVASNSMHAKYAGKELKSRTKLILQICLWDEKDIECWSDEAYFEMGLLNESDWCANWISGIDIAENKHLPADYYKKSFNTGNDIKKARLYATCHGVYVAKVNGQTVSSFLAPGTTEYEKRLYYQTYDVTDCLKENSENDLQITVADGWYKGKLGADQNEFVFGNKLKLLAQLEVEYKSGKKQIISTDESFLWTNDGNVRFADLKDGEIYDATKEPTFDTNAVTDAECHVIPTASNAPAICKHEVFEGVLKKSPNGENIIDFGQNIAGIIRFRIKAAKGEKITVRLFEATDHGEYSDASLSFPNGDVNPVKQTVEYTAKGKDDEYEAAFFYSGFQYAWVSGNLDISASKFEAIAIYSDIDYYGKFLCSNENINKFVNNTIWSMKSNFVDVPTDCPQREKSGWTGDAQVFCNTANYFADTKPFYLKWLKDVRDCQREDGLVVDVNPKVSIGGTMRDMVNGSCGWADGAIIIPYTLWKTYGDIDVITENYELMHAWKEYMIKICGDKSMFSLPEGHPLKGAYDMCRLEENPLNKYIPEYGIHWGEWCVPQSQEPSEYDPAMALMLPKQEVTCAYTHYSMTLLAEMLEAIGRGEEAKECMEYAEGSKAAYHVHWLKDKTVVTNHMAELVRPIALGIADEDEEKNIAAKLNEMCIARGYKVGTGFLSTPFLLQTLAKNGYINTAYAMLENEEAPGWLAMVKQGATTVWEEYECYDENQSPLPHSFNHYSPGAVCSFLFDTVAGIKVDSENHFVITPIPGGSLKNAKAEVMTPYGLVTSQWKRDGNNIVFVVNIPTNTKADLVLPNGEVKGCNVGENYFEIKGE